MSNLKKRVVHLNGLFGPFDGPVVPRPDDSKDASTFAHEQEEITHAMVGAGWEPYWGAFEGEAVISLDESRPFVIGPSGGVLKR